jgi:putative DNA primase/helicase
MPIHRGPRVVARGRARSAADAVSGRDWQAFDAELRARAPEIAAELLGKPSSRSGQEWRWGRKGSLAVVITGARTGMWFDHEAGTGGGLVDLVARTRGLSRREALDWTADRIGLAGDVGQLRRPANREKRPAADIPDTSARATPERGHEAPAETAARPEATSPAAMAAARGST